MSRRLVVLAVLGAMAAMMLAFAGVASAQTTCQPGDYSAGCNPENPPPPPPPCVPGDTGCDPENPPPPSPPPGGGVDEPPPPPPGGNPNPNPPGGGGNNGGGFVPGTFIQFGAGFPFSGTTTADFGALPTGNLDGGFSITVQPQPVVVVEPVVVQPPTTLADQIVSDTFGEVGLE